MTHETICAVSQGISVGIILSWTYDYFFPRRRQHVLKHVHGTDRALKELTGNAFRENMRKVLGVELCPVCDGTVGDRGCKVCNGQGVI